MIRKKIIILLIGQFSISTCLYSQSRDNIFATCDTFSISGYVIFLSKYNPTNKAYDTYYGFCQSSEVHNNERLKSLLKSYIHKEKFKGLSDLSNICEQDFNFVKDNLDETFISSPSDGYEVISSICDSLKRNYLYRSLYPESKEREEKVNELPNSSSYYISTGKFLVHELKPLISVRKMDLQCIEILYKSFEMYYKNELYPRRNARPPNSFSGYNKEHIINLQEVKRANKKDGYYHILVPISRSY